MKPTEKLVEVIDKLNNVAVDNMQWNITIKSNIYLGIKEAIEDLQKLQKQLAHFDSTEMDFIELAYDKPVVRLIKRQKLTGPTYIKATVEEVRRDYQNSTESRTEFDGQRLKLVLYESERDLLSDSPIYYAIDVSEF